MRTIFILITIKPVTTSFVTVNIKTEPKIKKSFKLPALPDRIRIMKKFKRTGTFYVYILECRDGTYYTGFTPDLERRVELHNTGKGAKYTRDRRPVKLIWFRVYKYFRKAFLEERRIKRLSRPRKEKLVYER